MSFTLVLHPGRGAESFFSKLCRGAMPSLFGFNTQHVDAILNNGNLVPFHPSEEGHLLMLLQPSYLIKNDKIS
jgi:hypothetical protein